MRFFLRAVLLVGVPVVMAAFAAEIFVRVRTEFVTPEILAARSLSYDPAVFARHVLTAGARELSGPEPGQRYRVNRHGYRGPEFSWVKPPGNKRVLIYGGSTVFDIKADEGEDWPRLVERSLRERGFHSAEVINAGIPGHASFDSFGRFFAEGHQLRPDVVVLYDQWNDLKTFRKSGSLLRTLDPYRRGEDLRFDYGNGIDRMLCETSQLYVRLRARFLSRAGSVDLEGRTTRELSDGFGPEGPEQFRISVASFVDVVRNAGATPVLVLEARLVDATNGAEERARIRLHYHGLTHAGLVRAYAVTDSILAEVAREKGAVLVDASAGLSGSERYFADYVHLNREGAAVVAERVAEAVAEILRHRE